MIEKNNRNIAPFLRDFFERLDRNDVTWAILRNADGLPEWTRYDVDVLVKKSAQRITETHLRAAAEANGWKIVGVIKKRCYQCFLASDGVAFLPIDIFNGLEYRAHRIANSEAGLTGRMKNEKGIWQTSPGFDSAVTIVKELLPHACLKENSRDEVKRGAQSDIVGFRAALAGVVTEDLIIRLSQFATAGNWPDLEAMTKRLRHEYRSLSGTYLFRYVDFLWKNLRHHFSPSVSCMIALMAPDGSGKTTIADALSAELHKQPFKDCRYLRANFDVLPKLSSLKHSLQRRLGRTVPQKEFVPPGTRHSGMIKPNSRLRSLLYTTYYAADLFLGRIRLRRMRAQWNLIVFDRSFYDYYFQIGNSHCPRWYLNLLEKLIPKPDLLIFLDRNAEEIFAGKPELTVDEIEREQCIIRSIVSDKPFGVIIDASNGVERTVDQLKTLVLEKAA